MKYFLTGATGFVGGRVARQLREAGHEVVAVVRAPEKAEDLAALGVQLHKGDVTDKESMRRPMAAVDGVFHVAGWYKIGARDKSQAIPVNVDGTRNVLELMKELRIPKGVYTSSLVVFSDTRGRLVDETYRFEGTHLSEYDRTKWLAHELAETMILGGLPLVIVMPGVVYGPGDTSDLHAAFTRYLWRTLPMIPSQTAFCWAHVDDVARAHLLAMEKGKPGETYIIAGPRHTLVEALELAEKITGIPAPRWRASPGLLKALSTLMRVIEKFTYLPEIYTAESLRVAAGVTYLGDNAKARRELGYQPRPLDADAGLRETLEYEMKRWGMKRPISDQTAVRRNADER